jgi:hypothetical protein
MRHAGGHRCRRKTRSLRRSRYRERCISLHSRTGTPRQPIRRNTVTREPNERRRNEEPGIGDRWGDRSRTSLMKRSRRGSPRGESRDHVGPAAAGSKRERACATQTEYPGLFHRTLEHHLREANPAPLQGRRRGLGSSVDGIPPSLSPATPSILAGNHPSAKPRFKLLRFLCQQWTYWVRDRSSRTATLRG